MIREYGLLQHKKDGMDSWKAGGVQNSFFSSELIDNRPGETGDLERLQKMSHFLEIIRNLQWQLMYKCKRLGQELVFLSGSPKFIIISCLMLIHITFPLSHIPGGSRWTLG